MWDRSRSSFSGCGAPAGLDFGTFALAAGPTHSISDAGTFGVSSPLTKAQFGAWRSCSDLEDNFQHSSITLSFA